MDKRLRFDPATDDTTTAWRCSLCKGFSGTKCWFCLEGGCPGTRAEGRAPTPAEAAYIWACTGRYYPEFADEVESLRQRSGTWQRTLLLLQQRMERWPDASKARGAYYGGRRVRRGRSQPSTAAHDAPHGGGEERSAAGGPGERSVVVNGERFYARGAGPGEKTGADAAHGVPNDTPRQHERPGEARSGGEAATGGGLSLVIGGVTIHAPTVEISGVAIYARGEAPGEAGRGGAAGEAVASDGATGGPEGATTAHGEPSGSQRQHGWPGEASGAHGV
jgi:hypothetical protein